MQAEIVAIGDEMTSGQRLDTNSQWLSLKLGDIGVPVRLHTTTGDDLAAIIEVFRSAINRADVVVATGGLGPTADDLTRDALAAALGVPLEERREALEHLQRLFAARGRPMPERNRLQALFPVGSQMIGNPHGSAPGIYAQFSRPGGGACHLFALPGVPAEMFEMWQATVAPILERLRPVPGVLRHRVIRLFGPGESELEAMFPELIARERFPRVGITVSNATISLRITAWGTDDRACYASMEETVREIYSAAGRFIFGEGEVELEHVLLAQLQQRGATLASNESFTSGLLAHWLATADPDALAFRGGMIHPTPPDERAMARAAAVRSRFATTFGLAVASAIDNRVEVAWHDGVTGDALQITRGGHPAVEGPRIAKSALDLLRRHLVGADPDSG